MISLFIQLAGLIFSREKKRILVIFQNNNELRGGGGYMTQIVEVVIGKMSIQKKFLNDYSDLRGTYNIEPPKPMKELLKVDKWFFRDANYYGDFSKSAKQIIKLFKQIYPQKKVSGVCAINFSFVEDILHIIGKVRVHGQSIQYSNIFSFLSSSVSNVDRHDMKELNVRKNILNDLFKTILKSCIIKFWKWPEFMRLIKESLLTKDLQIYFKDKKNIPSGFDFKKQKDFIAVIENNFLGLKSNRYIRRMINHDVNFSFNRDEKRLGDAIVNVTVTIEHFGSYDYPLSGLYQSYVSVYFPLDATNISSQLPYDSSFIEKESSTQTICYKVLLNPGNRNVFSFTYTLPASLFYDNKYSFRFYKQSGVKNEHIFDSLRFPDNYEFKNHSGNLQIVESKAFSSHSQVNKDYEFSLNSALHTNTPRVFYHEIVAPKTIQIRFNEPVNFINEKKSDNRGIKVFDKETNREFNIDKVELKNDNRHLWLYVKDLPLDIEKFYIVSLSNIQSLAGIPLQPNPKTVTVVCRNKK
jgi:hypothetical protein